MDKVKKLFIVAVGFLFLLLAACGSGSSDSAKQGSSSDKDQSSQTTSSSAEKQKSQRKITIHDAMGKQVIKGVPEDVVSLEFFFTAHLLTLGVQPVGAADIEGFKKWVSTKNKLADSVKDVGQRQEPNLEAIARTNPDIIFAAKFRHQKIADRLKDIAPVVMFAPYGKDARKNLYKEMIREFKKVAKILDKQKQAKQALNELDAFYKKQRQRLKEAGMAGTKYISALAFSSQNSPVIRLYSDNSIVVQVLDRLGLKNMYHSDKLRKYGFTKTGVETLQNFQEKGIHFLYIAQKDDNIFKNQLQGNPVWENLSFVKAGNVHHLAGDTPVFGGVSSMKILAKRVVDALIKE